MNSKSFRLFLLLIFLISSAFFSCKNNRREIQIDNSDTISLSPAITWAVVVEPYAAFRKEATWDSPVHAHCRFGDVLMIEGNAIMPSTIDENAKEIWYRFDKGWLSETSVSVYQNKLKAQNAAKSMTK